ncbi:hypothetical protein ACFSR6_17910 [Pedobacter vanadiisoli]|uniref:Uncharacterized protein n=1 Tax=Pedobacter vanadiisoli TaxID=1761975 RepID=A0ABW5MME4_9SPHI
MERSASATRRVCSRFALILFPESSGYLVAAGYATTGGLNGYSSIHFWALQGADTFVPKPD